ncbi:MAG: hypothetical protein J5J06_12835 [Phycisphaerae bacterium]|nr:hypothetical protein [Phycisphaerae bacterium]
MAEIPSDIAASAAQAGYQAREVGRERDAARTGQSHQAQQQNRNVTEAGEIVDTAELGTRVYSDAEGAGSQGRPFESDDEQTKPESDDETPDDDRPDGERPHLDIRV